MATTAAVGDAVAVSAAPVVVGVVGAGRVVLAGATEVVVPADVVVRVRAGCAARSSSARWNSPVLGLLGQRFGEDRVQRCQLGNPIADRRG